MRCSRCRKDIAGIGKPAVPPVLAALVAFAGSIWGLFSLTLGQDPNNALPHYTPVTGWGLCLGSLALASVLAWIGLARRKCPECGCTRMLDAMEEEGLTASERLAAQRAAVDDARAEIERKAHTGGGSDLRAAIEAELRSSFAKETADKLAAQEKELRATVEQEVRGRVVREMQPQIEARLRAEIEKQLGASPQRPPAAERPVTPAPITSAKAIASPVPQTAPRSVTPAPITTARAIASPVPQTAPRPVTPAPVTTARAIAPTSATRTAAPTLLSHAMVKTAAPPASAIPKTSQPAAPHAKVDTAPLSLLSSAGKLPVRSPAAAASPHAAPPKTAPSAVARPADPAGRAEAPDAAGGGPAAQERSTPPPVTAEQAGETTPKST